MTFVGAGVALALAAALAQTRPPPVPPCFPAGAQINAFESRWFCGLLAAAGEGSLGGPTAYRLVYAPAFRRQRLAPGHARAL